VLSLESLTVGVRGAAVGASDSEQAGHELRKVKEQHPELRVIRARGQSWSRKMLAGAEGAVVHFVDEASMRDSARRRLRG
jgi:hypothetical protein